MAAKLYFVTGKGGVGKTSLANLLAQFFRESRLEKTLLLRINSFSLSHEPPENDAELQSQDEQNLYLHRVVEEYFTVTLSKIPLPGSVRWVTQRLNDSIAKKLLANRYVLKFIEACPGLTPTIFLGKLCREAIEGTDRTGNNWKNVVVDAPSTGQALQIFESAKTLSRVLSQGPVHKHIIDTLNFVFTSDFEIHLLTLPEEGPLQECLETIERLKVLELFPKRIWMNRVFPPEETTSLQSALTSSTLTSDVRHAIEVELERIKDQRELIEDFRSKIGNIALSEIAEKKMQFDQIQGVLL